MENEEYLDINDGLSVGTMKIASKHDIFTEEEIDAIDNKIPELDERVGVIEDEIDDINSSLDEKVNIEVTNKLQGQINNLIISNDGESNAEVVQARGRNFLLNDRLNAMDNALGEVVVLSNNMVNFNNTLGKTVGEIWNSGTWVTIANVTGLLKDNTDYFVGINSINSMINYRTIDIEGNVVAQKSSGKLNASNLSSSYSLQLYLGNVNIETYKDTIINELYLNEGKNYGYDVYRSSYNYLKENNNEINELKKEIDMINDSLGERVVVSNNLADDSISHGKTLNEIWSSSGWTRVAIIGTQLKDNTDYYIGFTCEVTTIFSCRIVDKEGNVVGTRVNGIINSSNLSRGYAIELYLGSTNLNTYSNVVLENVYLNLNETSNKRYDEFKLTYSEQINVINTLLKNKANSIVKSFPRLEKIISLAVAAVTSVDDELCFLATGVDDHSNFVNITFRNKDDFSVTKTLNHNWGHANTIDYNKFSDSLILGNGSQNTIEDIGEIYIIQNFKSIKDKENNTELPLSEYATTISLTGYNYGYKANVIWGESNGGRGDICYLITSDMRYIRKLQLGKGNNNLGLGQFSSVEENKFNGSFRVIQTWENDYANTEQLQDAQFYNGKIYAGFGHYGNTIKEIELLEDGDINVTTWKELLYDEKGEVLTDRYSQGICILNNKMYFSNAKTVSIYSL